jgi:hypothetical protein
MTMSLIKKKNAMEEHALSLKRSVLGGPSESYAYVLHKFLQV